MGKLFFVCQWGRKRDKAWSGTYNSLYKALQQHFTVVDVNIRTSIVDEIKLFLHTRLNICKYDFMYNSVRRFDKKSKEMDDVKGCSLQFTELCNNKKNIHSYIYQDMCVSYLQEKIIPDNFLSPFFHKMYSEDTIEERVAKQALFYEKCSGIFVMGEWLKKYMVESMGIDSTKIYCVGAGYDIPIHEIKEYPKNAKRILFVGKDFERKGGPFLIEAFHILREKYDPDVELFIVGPSPSKMKRDAGVHYIGSASKHELMEYYSLCDIFCMPSYLEPFGKVYIEALCCGLPVIARNKFAAPDFVIDGVNGLLIGDSITPAEMAYDIYNLLHDEKIKEYTKNHAHEYIVNYSWKSIARKMAEIIYKDPYFQDT